jgi:hypothetical protein
MASVEINPKLKLFHNTRHASARHRKIDRAENSTSPWLAKFDWIIDTNLDWKRGMRTMNKVKTERASPPKTVFVKMNHLRYFINAVLPTIDSDFVLCLGNADKSIKRVLNREQRKKLLSEKKIIKIFSEEKDIDSGRICAVPIGMHPAPLINYHKDLSYLIKDINIEEKKDTVCGGWSPWGKTIFGTRRDRVNARKYMEENKDFCDFFSGLSHTGYWEKVKSHKFFLSPLGTTYDSFKTFEALALKTIPIIQKLGVWQEAYEDLPVVVIDDFSQINPKNLELWWKELSPQLNNLGEKLTTDYQWQKILNEI